MSKIKKSKYTFAKLEEFEKRDNAKITFKHNRIPKPDGQSFYECTNEDELISSTYICFTCNCGLGCGKVFQCLFTSGAFCRDCTIKRAVIKRKDRKILSTFGTTCAEST